MNRTEICIRKIDEELQRQGFCYLETKDRETGLYYRKEGAVTEAVAYVWHHAGFAPAGLQLQVMKQRIAEIFGPQDRTEVLFLFVTEEPEYGKEIAAAVPGVWVTDACIGRIMKYENQPGDFYGIGSGLEQALSDVQEASYQKNENALGADRYREARTPQDWKRLLLYRADGSERAIVNTILVAVNILIWILMEIGGDTTDAGYVAEHGGLFAPYFFEGGKWYLLFTSMFIHFGIGHLANNMLVLFFLGGRVENAAGKLKYLVIYLTSGLGGSLLSLYMLRKNNPFTVSAGASGAIFGIVGALLWIVIANRGNFERLNTRGVMFMIFLCLYYGFTSVNTDNWGHIGGLLTGFVICALLYRRKNRTAST